MKNNDDMVPNKAKNGVWNPKRESDLMKMVNSHEQRKEVVLARIIGDSPVGYIIRDEHTGLEARSVRGRIIGKKGKIIFVEEE